MNAKKVKVTVFLLLIMQNLWLDVSAQQTKIAVQKLHQDVEFYFSTIQKVHPDPYAFASFQKVDSVKQQIIADIVQPLRRIEFAVKMELEANSLFDNHTKMHYIFHNPLRIDEFYNSHLFPWDIDVVENKLYLINQHGKQEIITINQQSTEEVMADLNKVFSADISEENKQTKIKHFFPLYYDLCYHKQNNSHFTITLQDIYGNITDLSKEGKGKQEVKEKIIANMAYTTQTTEDYQLGFYEDSIAVLTVNTFSYSDNSDYISFLDNSFKTIAEKSCKYLFIDIKNNGGGSSQNAFYLLDYLFDDDYKIFGYITLKRKSAAYIKEYGIEEGQKKRYKKGENIIDYGFFERIREVQHPYTKTLFLLQSNETASAALDMSIAIKSSRRGIVLGTPTEEPACSFSQAIVFTLPNTKLTFQSATGFFINPSGSHDIQWIQPDIMVDVDTTAITNSTLNSWIALAKKLYLGFFK